MSEYMSSAEYNAAMWREKMKDKPCKIIRFDWCAGKNLMVIIGWNGQERRTNISSACRDRFGKLHPNVREKIIAAAPEYVTIHTTIHHTSNNYRRYVHTIIAKELNAWLDRVEL